MTASRHRPVRKFLGGFVHAGRGIALMLRTERNARVHAVISGVVVLAGLYYGLSLGEWIAIVLAAAMVWAAELLNTALERLVDLASPKEHRLAGQAKDLAAGAVLMAAVGAGVVGAIVFLPKILS
jgi:diacylglycerol kinase (ATP)